MVNIGQPTLFPSRWGGRDPSPISPPFFFFFFCLVPSRIAPLFCECSDDKNYCRNWWSRVLELILSLPFFFPPPFFFLPGILLPPLFQPSALKKSLDEGPNAQEGLSIATFTSLESLLLSPPSLKNAKNVTLIPLLPSLPFFPFPFFCPIMTIAADTIKKVKRGFYSEKQIHLSAARSGCLFFFSLSLPPFLL